MFYNNIKSGYTKKFERCAVMTDSIYAVVCGSEILYEQLVASKQFTEVLFAKNGDTLISMMGKISGYENAAESVAFIFTDNMPPAKDYTTLDIIRTLLTTTENVFLIGLTSEAAEIKNKVPRVNLIKNHSTLNAILGALTIFSSKINPIDNYYDNLDLLGTSGIKNTLPYQIATQEPPAWVRAVKKPDEQVNEPVYSGTPKPHTQNPYHQPDTGLLGDRATGQKADQSALKQRGTNQPDPKSAPPTDSVYSDTATVKTSPKDQYSRMPAQPKPTYSSNTAAPGAMNNPGRDGVKDYSYGQNTNATNITSRLGRVIAIVAPKGGTGKSFLSLNLAATLGIHLSSSGKKVLLIDANTQQADIGKYINKYSPTVEELAKNPQDMSASVIINKYLAKIDNLGIYCLLGPNSPTAAMPTFINGSLYKSILNILKPEFDYIIIDTQVAEPYSDMFVNFVIPYSEFFLAVATPNNITVTNVSQWLGQMSKPLAQRGGGIPAGKLGYVINQASSTVGLNTDQIRQQLSAYTLVGIIPDSDEVKRFSNNFSVIAAYPDQVEMNNMFKGILHTITREKALATSVVNVNNKPKKSSLVGLLKKSKRK